MGPRPCSYSHPCTKVSPFESRCSYYLTCTCSFVLQVTHPPSSLLLVYYLLNGGVCTLSKYIGLLRWAPATVEVAFRYPSVSTPEVDWRHFEHFIWHQGHLLQQLTNMMPISKKERTSPNRDCHHFGRVSIYVSLRHSTLILFVRNDSGDITASNRCNRPHIQRSSNDIRYELCEF
jgi:hypothetical protein